MFPTPAVVNPFQSSSGPSFYAVNFTIFLGLGYHADLLALLFGATIIYVLVRIFQKKTSSVNPIAIALIVSFVAMFAYYSLGWPYSDLRYSTEIIMPVIILSFYGILLVVENAKPAANSLKGAPRTNSLTYIIALTLIVLILVISLYPSGYSVLTTTRPQEADLNTGLIAAANWMHIDVPRATI